MKHQIDELASLSPAQRALLENRLRRRRSETPSTAIPCRQDAGVVPLSFAQQRLWFIEQLDPESAAYNIAGAVRLSGTLDVEALRRGFDEILKRHDVLRTSVTATDGEPVQTIHPHRPFALPVVEVQGSDDAGRILEARQLAAEEAGRPFDLGESPLLRARLLRLADRDHVLVLAMHHIASDGWSTGIVLRELSAVYAALVEKGRSPVSVLPVQYADFAAWQRKSLEGDVLARQVSWWREALADMPAMELPADRVRPAVQSARGARHRHPLPQTLSRGIQELSRSQAVTPFSVLLAAFDILLSRYCGSRDVVVGSPVAGRNRTELEGLVGLFVNTLVLRAEVNPDATFADLVHRVQQGVLDALARQDVPFEMLVDELRPQRTLSHSPLTPILFAFQNVPMSAVQLPGLSLAPFEFERTTARFDLCLFAVDTGKELVLSAEYSTDLFDASTIAHLLSAFEGLLSSIVIDPGRRVADLPWVGSHERDELIHRWNQTSAEYPRDKTVAELFEAQVKARPDALALLSGDRRLTYAQLNVEANRLARHIEAMGVSTGALVGICLERSIEMIVATLAIVKAGAAYVPLDPAYPDTRLEQMLEDCAARIVITTDALRGRLPASTSVVCVDREADAIARHLGANLLARSTAGSRAYVMYTSGSTGAPKGVEVIHRGITRLLFGVDYVRLGPGETILQLAPFSFDAATFEIWGALLHGGRLVLYADRVPTARELGDTIRAHGVTTMWLTGSLYNAIVDESPEALRGLRQLLIGGDALSVPHVRRGLHALPGVQFINGYGPTESTTFTCCEPIADDLPADARSVPIGRPIGNTWVYLLDPALNPVPVGAPGELYIGGDGLALGYLGAPALTAERFVADPFRAGKRLYRSGDLARYLSDGRLEFLGRLDQQVKIRGYRIECGEIEAALVASAGIREAVVVPIPDDGGRKRLVAYIVPDPAAEPGVHDLRRRLLDALPEYMVPSAFVYMPSLPLTRNGKVDRAALPDPAAARAEDARDRQAPRTERETILSRIWAQVLRLDDLGVHDNFFELGGDSILSIQIVARANDQGLALRPKDIFKYQTIAELAEAVEERPIVSAEQGEVVGPTAPTPIERWFFDLKAPKPQHFNQAIVLDLGADISVAALEGAVRAVLSHHDALRLRFEQIDGVWQGAIAPSSAVLPFETIDLRHLPLDEQPAAIERVGSDLNARLTLDGGLARFAVILVRGGARLVSVVHHVAIDGVSWRVVIEDLHTACLQLRRGERVRLPPKTTSWRTWTGHLATLTDDAATISEETFWLDVARDTKSIPLDAAARPALNTIDGADRLSAALPADETVALLQDVPGAFHTQVTDVLLAGLALSFRGWAQPGAMLVDLERHGREPLFDDDDVTRTVGWFTTICPVRIDVSAEDDPIGVLKSTKERLRAIPRNGIGYGLLRYLSADPAVRARLAGQPAADISFNYLGQFDQIGSDETWRFAAESPGQVWDGKTPRAHLIDITAIVVDGSLRFTWTYSRAAFRRETIERLAAALVGALRTLTRTCTTPGVGGWTPSDFPLARLDQRSLDVFQATHPGMADVYPLSPLQHGLLFHALDGSSTGAYVEQVSCTIDAPFDPVAFQAAWARIIERHAVLRTVFDWETLDAPVQIVLDRVSPAWAIEDWREAPADKRGADLDAWLAADVARGFELNRPPLQRFALIRISDSAWRFVWSFHHILLDGWCLPIILKEVAAGYAAIVAGRQVEDVRHQPYRDYIAWLQREDGSAAETFWRGELKGFRTATPMPINRTSAASGECRVHLAEATTTDLQSFARREQITMSTVVQAAWAIVLARCTGEHDVVFGTTMAGRPARLAGVETMIGLFINTLPLRTEIAWDEPVLPWLKRLQDRLLAIRDHEHVGLSDVQRWSDMPNGSSLFESFVVFENYPIDAKAPAGASGVRLRDFSVRERSNFPLTLVASPGARLQLKLVHTGADAETAVRLLGAVQQVLTAIAAEPTATLSSVALLTDEESREQTEGWNAIDRSYPRGASIASLVSQQAVSRPDAIALQWGSSSVTYGALEARANQVARHLRRHGVRRGAYVALMVERGPQLIVGMLAILKAGGAYVPLDPDYPAERLAFMLDDTAPPVLLAERKLVTALPPAFTGRVICLDDEAAAIDLEAGDVLVDESTGSDAAYVMYTSGSTGRPKGVCVPQHSITRLVWQADFVGLCKDDVVAQASNASFDAATFEIWGALVNGARLVGVPRDIVLSPDSLGRHLAEQGITTLFLTTALFNQVAREHPAAFACLHHLLFGGEAVDPRAVDAVLQAGAPRRLLHVYGPTENTTFSTWYQVHAVAGNATTVPIGRGITSSTVYVLTPRLQLVPRGVPGEVFVGGEGLATGYLHHPALTADRFVPSPFGSGQRLYRTGDVGRWNADGQLEFLGRTDEQVKIRGFRIEPGEVEAVLMAHPEIRAAAVLARENPPGVKRLFAYVVGTSEDLNVAGVRAYLKARLPDYMVPSAIVALPALPVNANGKLDRSALPMPDDGREADAAARPATSVEITLARIWAQVLGVEDVGIHDNFFELGGDSILSIQIVARATEAGLRLTVKDLFEHQTVAGLASVAAPRTETAGSAEPMTGPVALLPIQHWFFEQDLADAHHFNQSALLSVDGVPASVVEEAVCALIVHHDALRARFTRTHAGWTSRIETPEASMAGVWSRVAVPSSDGAAAEDAIGRAAAALQASLDLEHGPLVRAAFFDGLDEPRLLIVVHHLVVDAVSWRILLADLEQACSRRLAGQPIVFAPKSGPVSQWADRLVAYADSHELDTARTWWRGARAGGRLPVDYSVSTAVNTIGAVASVSVELSTTETRALLQDVPKAYHTQINDALLTALAQAAAPWTLDATLAIDLEGHGRDPQFDDIDLSRTVGWFTTISPIRLTLPAGAEPGASLRAVKEQLRAVPGGGLAFGALRYLSRDAAVRTAMAAAATAEIGFNYLGQYDQQQPGRRLLAPVAGATGSTASPRQRRRHLIEVIGMVADGRLRLQWAYCPHIHSRATIDALAQRFIAALRALIVHCTTPGVGAYTPSDFPLAALEEAQLDEVLSQVEFE